MVGGGGGNVPSYQKSGGGERRNSQKVGGCVKNVFSHQCRNISLICFEDRLLQISGSILEITRIPQMGKPSNCTPILVCQLTETLLGKQFNAYLMRRCHGFNSAHLLLWFSPFFQKHRRRSSSIYR